MHGCRKHSHCLDPAALKPSHSLITWSADVIPLWSADVIPPLTQKALPSIQRNGLRDFENVISFANGLHGADTLHAWSRRAPQRD